MPDPVEPFDLALAKKRLRIAADDRDDEITQLCLAARHHIEHHCEQVLTTPRAVVETFAMFPRVGPMRLRTRPVQTVDRIDYLDVNGAAAFLLAPDINLVIDQVSASIYPLPNAAWPTVWHRGGQVQVTVTAGYLEKGGDGPDAAWPDVPPDLVAAMMMMARHLFDNPNAVVVGTIASELPLGVRALCAPHSHAY